MKDLKMFHLYAVPEHTETYNRVCPADYYLLWTGGKCFYAVERQTYAVVRTFGINLIDDKSFHHVGAYPHNGEEMQSSAFRFMREFSIPAGTVIKTVSQWESDDGRRRSRDARVWTILHYEGNVHFPRYYSNPSDATFRRQLEFAVNNFFKYQHKDVGAAITAALEKI